jgi:vacuolar-type H+-ATPase subunit H
MLRDVICAHEEQQKYIDRDQNMKKRVRDEVSSDEGSDVEDLLTEIRRLKKPRVASSE